MATRLKNVDRNTPMLLPPDLREWVAEDDIVHFVIQAVEGMNLRNLKVHRRGSGSEQYPPKMMLALLIYSYANGIFSSRRIERATYRDVAVRYLAGNTHPDHDTICTFRRENFDLIAEAFLHILFLARELGVLEIGTVSIDGTHIKASASKHKNVRYDRAGELEQQLRLDIDELLEKAEQYDSADESDGQSLPEEISRRERLLEKMQKARETLEKQANAQAEAERAAYEKKLEEREKHAGKHKGKKPKPPDDTPRDLEQINLTDADSKLMRKHKLAGYTQSYNAQATVDADGSQLILACDVITCASDANELKNGIDGVPKEVGEVRTALADCGYVNADAMEEIEASGANLYVAVSREENHDHRRYDYRAKSVTDKPPKVIKDPRLIKMREKVQSDEGRDVYKKRKQTVEPVFGIVKSVMGFDEFLLRGLEKVKGEWSLVSLAHNTKRLWNRAQPA